MISVPPKGPWLGTIFFGFRPRARPGSASQWVMVAVGIRERRLRLHRHVAREQHAVDQHHGVAVRVVRAHGADLRLQAAEIQRVFARRTRCRRRDASRPVSSSLLSSERAAKTGTRFMPAPAAMSSTWVFERISFESLRKCVRAHVVLGMHVGGHEVDRLAGAHLRDFAQHRLARCACPCRCRRPARPSCRRRCRHWAPARPSRREWPRRAR